MELSVKSHGKSCDTLVDLKDLRLVLEEDGTEVDSDEYLEILPQQAVLVAVSKGRDWKPAHNHLKEVLSSFENANKLGPLKLAVEELLSKKEHRPQILRLIGEISGSIDADSKAHLETYQEDPDWFLNVGRCFRTKDQYMRENARRRIRGYLRMSSDYVKRHKILAARHRHEIESIFRWFADELLENDEFSDYFARSSDNEEVRMCDGEGWFRCEGLYDSDRCGFEHHRINPYASQHHRVLFSTWNLDHGYVSMCLILDEYLHVYFIFENSQFRIERSREVLPRLIEAISRKSGRTVNARYFFDLMFTRCN
ncbi:hypothetical protein CAPTEDRAFT_220983 [Capitella teleta]|uniref:CIDE-N domain-containing protein n=1 Tax=Capitella teleta TaxID=283909 RepID=R7TWY3_CAPTE|nr:hypothetical protein CAPTEDRAFT_220983 [Capitella teleta]|eukprot:ELT95485.1 hypothetical protein CAPTEDRAFT_220983 [Capitella teleta]